MFLSHEEICELTGAKQRAGQIETLRRNGVRHTIKRSGWPCVLRAHLINPESAKQHTETTGWQPRKVS